MNCIYELRHRIYLIEVFQSNLFDIHINHTPLSVKINPSSSIRIIIRTFGHIADLDLIPLSSIWFYATVSNRVWQKHNSVITEFSELIWNGTVEIWCICNRYNKCCSSATHSFTTSGTAVKPFFLRYIRRRFFRVERADGTSLSWLPLSRNHFRPVSFAMLSGSSLMELLSRLR